MEKTKIGELVRSSWAGLPSQSAVVDAWIDDLRQHTSAFDHVNLPKHKRVAENVLKLVVLNSDQLEVLADDVRAIGARHRDYGANSYDLLFATQRLIDTIGAQFISTQAYTAWTLLLVQVGVYLLEGFLTNPPGQNVVIEAE